MKSLALLVAVALLAHPAAALAKAKRPGVWPQAYTDRPADPTIRFGQLPNGLRYAIRRNGTPAGEISLRLYIGSGSLAEPAGSEGLAHFLEHMAFRGSAAVPDGEAMRMLARQGLAVGADANAATSPEATTFSFDFPQGGKPALDTGLLLFREIASKLTLTEKAVDAERGVVLAEERLRDGPGLHAAKASLGFLLQGQPAADRLPIGHVDVITHATARQIRAYYEANYRPENAAIVAVGDFDPAAVEAQIKGLFADWQGKGALPPLALGTPAKRGEEVRLFSEPGAPTSAQIGWVRPFDDRADTQDREREDYDRVIGLVALNQRLQDIARRGNPPFLGAGVNKSAVFGSADATTLNIGLLAASPLPSLRAAVSEQQRAVRFGFSPAEIERARQSIETVMSTLVAGADSRPSPQIANAIVKDIGTNEVTRNPRQDIADIQEWNRFLSPRTVNAAVKRAFTGSGPLIYVSTAQPLPGGEAAVRAAFDGAGQGLAAPTAAAADLAGWPYASFGPPGRVTDKRVLADIGVTIVTFANGVVLGVKPQKVAAGEIWVNTSFGQGRLGLPLAKAQSYWMVGLPQILMEGGTGKLNAGEIQRLLTGKNVTLGLLLGDDVFALQGRTGPRDLLTELQLQAAYLTDPGFRPEAVTRVQTGLGAMVAQIDATPTGVARRDLPAIMHGNDPRWAPLPTAAQLAQSRPQDLIALIDPALGGALSVAIAGDTTVDQAIEAVAATLGALPPRPARAAPDGAAIRPPPPLAAPITLYHSGRADQAVAFQGWPTDGYLADPRDALALSVAAAAIKARLFDQLREAEGATYSPEVGAIASNVLPHYGVLDAQIEVAPDKAARVFALLDSITADLRAKPLSADELDRAKRPLIDKRQRDLQTNPFWTGVIALGLRDSRAFDAVRTMQPIMEKIGPADVQRVAGRYLLPGRAIHVVVKAKGAP